MPAERIFAVFATAFRQAGASRTLSPNDLPGAYRMISSIASASLRDNQFESAFESSTMGLGVAIRMADDKPTIEIAESLYNLSLAAQGDACFKDLAATYAIKAVRVWEACHDPAKETKMLRGLLYQHLGSVYWEEKKCPETIAAYVRAIDEFHAFDARTGKNSEVLCHIIHNNLGLAYKTDKQYENALKHYMETYRWEEKRGFKNKYLHGMLEHNIGRLYQDMGDPEKALDYALRGLRIRKATLGRDDQEVSISLNTVAQCYMELNQPKKALPYYVEELNRATRCNEEEAAAISNDGIAGCYIQLQDWDKALKYLLDAKPFYDRAYGLHPQLASLHCRLAHVYTRLNNFERALLETEALLEIAEEFPGRHAIPVQKFGEQAEALRALIGAQQRGETIKGVSFEFSKIEENMAGFEKLHPGTSTFCTITLPGNGGDVPQAADSVVFDKGESSLTSERSEVKTSQRNGKRETTNSSRGAEGQARRQSSSM